MQNPVLGLLLHELDIGKKDVANTLTKKAPNTIDIDIQSRLKEKENALQENPISLNSNNNNNNNFLPPRHLASPPPSPL